MIRLRGGRVIDPANNRDGVGDIWIDGERIATAPPQGKAAETYDVAGKIVMAGGIDIHSHIAGANVNTARLMLAGEDREPIPLAADPPLRAAAMTTFENGCRYAQMGFTLVVDPAVNPADALHAHIELATTPIIDRGALIILGNEDFLLRMLRDRESPDMVQDYAMTVLHEARGLGVKVINAGGAAAFRHNRRLFSLEDEVPSYGVTSRDIVLALQSAVQGIGIPHPLHVHCNNLGLAGSAETAQRTMDAANGPLHLAHLQFYGYGTGGKRGISSAAALLAEQVNRLPHITIDVGQVMFGPTFTVSADTLRQFDQKRFARPRKWTLWEDEGNGGGVFPIVYGEGEPISALQWAIGLELFLMIKSPWQVYFTTDHPNGAPFTRYPEILHLLMSAEERDRWVERLPRKAFETTALRDIRREYSLTEIATMTRAAPARLLGLADRGHLGTGAIADIAVYDDRADRTAMFARADLVFKNGELVVRDGAISKMRWGRTLSVQTSAPRQMRERLSAYRDDKVPTDALRVREAAVASVAGVQSVFEAVPCLT